MSAARDDLYAQMLDTDAWGLFRSITLSMSNGTTDIQLSQHYKKTSHVTRYSVTAVCFLINETESMLNKSEKMSIFFMLVILVMLVDIETFIGQIFLIKSFYVSSCP